MGDVLEYLVDGTSGISPGGVEGSAIVAGVCSKGQVGKGYLLGPSSDLEGLLGVGPLVERARDMLATGGQSPTLIAVPCTGEAKGYFTDIVTTRTILSCDSYNLITAHFVYLREYLHTDQIKGLYNIITHFQKKSTLFY